jgi:hypothetical protein
MIPPLFGKQEVGIWRVQKRFPRYGVPIWSLWPNIRFLPSGVYCFTSVRPSVQDIFRHIFLSNCWWQKSDICSQASYRYPISWEAFFDPSDSYFLFAEEWGYHKWALAHSSSWIIGLGLMIGLGLLVFNTTFNNISGQIIGLGLLCLKLHSKIFHDKI